MDQKNQIAHFPHEIVEKMLERQVEQSRLKNICTFQNSKIADSDAGGFTWENTPEGKSFWYEVINDELFDVFFEMYPKDAVEVKKESEYPRVMMVSRDGESWTPRVVFAEKCDYFIAWKEAHTIEAADDIVETSAWKFAKDPEMVILTIEQIAEKFELSSKHITIKS